MYIPQIHITGGCQLNFTVSNTLDFSTVDCSVWLFPSILQCSSFYCQTDFVMKCTQSVEYGLCREFV